MVKGGISTVNILSGDYFNALTLKLTFQHINHDHNCSVNVAIMSGAEQSSMTLYHVPATEQVQCAIPVLIGVYCER